MSATESPAEILERLAAEREAPAPQKTIRLAITGGRAYAPSPGEMAAFRSLVEELVPTELHHGAAKGVDSHVALWMAREYPAVKVVAHPPDWTSLGKAAGPIRNREMMTRCEVLAAFPGGRGTQNCVLIARQQGKRVVFIRS